VEISRYVVSRGGWNADHTGFGFWGVMGPDEFHMMVNNDYYTNYMGGKTLRDTLSVLARIGDPDAWATPAERAEWQEICDHIIVHETPEHVFEQHDGFFTLPHLDIHAIPISDFPLYEHWSYDRIYRSDMIKQPDVLMMLYLYNTSFSETEKRVNYEFYEPRTIHESSLSPAIHSILAAELGKMEEAVRFFGFATRLDLDNYNRNTREGLHVTSIAMAWANIVYGFAGLRSDGDGLRFAPRLPERWRKLCFSMVFKGRVIHVCMEKEATRFRLERGEEITVLVYGKPYALHGEDTLIPCQ